MGIVNATPDSFSDGAVDFTPELARERACSLAANGADIIDLGAESTRPGAECISAEEEISRLLPALAAIRQALPSMPISVDTYKPEVAEAAISSGADIINDVHAIRSHETANEAYAMGVLAARLNCPLIAMHSRPRPNYKDFWQDFLKDIEFGVARILNCGVSENQLWLDPGFGFGKTPDQNLQIVARLREIAAFGFPVLLGTSRKSTLGIVLGGKPPQERTGGDSSCCAIGAFNGATCLRLHDVAAHKDNVVVSDAIFRARMKTEPED